MPSSKKLEKYKDDQLRDLAKKVEKAAAGNNDTIHDLYRRIDHATDSIKRCYTLSKQAKHVIGKRKGISCPAMKNTVQEGTSYYTCKAETWERMQTSFNFFHRCAGCDLSPKQAFNKMVYVNVFQKNSRSSII